MDTLRFRIVSALFVTALIAIPVTFAQDAADTDASNGVEVEEVEEETEVRSCDGLRGKERALCRLTNKLEEAGVKAPLCLPGEEHLSMRETQRAYCMIKYNIDNREKRGELEDRRSTIKAKKYRYLTFRYRARSTLQDARALARERNKRRVIRVEYNNDRTDERTLRIRRTQERRGRQARRFKDRPQGLLDRLGATRLNRVESPPVPQREPRENDEYRRQRVRGGVSNAPWSGQAQSKLLPRYNTRPPNVIRVINGRTFNRNIYPRSYDESAGERLRFRSD